MNRKYDWDRIISGYDPELYPSAREYCKEIGLNYHSWCNHMHRVHAKKGSCTRTRKNWEAYLPLYDDTRESLKQFCTRMDIPYQAFKAARYRAGLAEPLERKETIFDGTEGFFRLVEVADDLL